MALPEGYTLHDLVTIAERMWDDYDTLPAREQSHRRRLVLDAVLGVSHEWLKPKLAKKIMDIAHAVTDQPRPY